MDEHSTTATLEKIAPGLAWLPRVLRKKLEPKLVWGVIGVVASGLLGAASFAARAMNAEDRVDRLEKDVQKLQAQEETLHKIDNQLGVISTKLDNLAGDVAEQKRKWDRVEEVAEIPTKRMRRK